MRNRAQFLRRDGAILWLVDTCRTGKVKGRTCHRDRPSDPFHSLYPRRSEVFLFFERSSRCPPFLHDLAGHSWHRFSVRPCPRTWSHNWCTGILRGGAPILCVLGCSGGGPLVCVAARCGVLSPFLNAKRN